MKYLLLLIVCFISVHSRAGDAQEELHQLFSHIEDMINDSEHYHLTYQMTFIGKHEGEERVREEILINHYNNGEDKYIVMGDLQELIYLEGVFVTVNHEMQYISALRDTSGRIRNQGAEVISELRSVLDSARVSYQEDCGRYCFLVTLTAHQEYEYIELVFSDEAQPRLEKITAGVVPNSRGLEVIGIDYTTWDTSWKAGADFPDLTDYIYSENQDGIYKLQDRWTDYQYYQPQRLPEK